MPEPHDVTHDMSTMWLEVFLHVARQGSFTAAARTLGYTQSAVSRQVQALESQLNAVLFDRLPRGVRLTEAGLVLLPHAEAALDRLATARTELAALRSLDGGRLRVGAFATADAALIPRTLAAFRARHPRVAVTRTDGLSAQHLALLAAGELDLAVISTTQDQPPPGCDLTHLLDEPMLVALPRAHPLAGRPALRLSELADEEWIAGSSRPEDTLIQPALASGFRPRTGFVVREWIAKQGYVAAGLGITLVPALAADSVRPDITLVAVHPDDVPYRAVYAATPRGLTRSAAVAAFVGLLRETVPRLSERIPA